MQSLTDQVAVVTGAARGIGRGIASVLGAEGAHVVICDLDGAAAERAASELRAEGIDALPIPVDVTDRAGVEAMAATMNIAVDTLTDEIEPYLLREQFLIRTPRGRVATVKAFQLLGKIPPKPKPDEKSLPTLFE